MLVHMRAFLLRNRVSQGCIAEWLVQHMRTLSRSLSVKSCSPADPIPTYDIFRHTLPREPITRTSYFLLICSRVKCIPSVRSDHESTR